MDTGAIFPHYTGPEKQRLRESSGATADRIKKMDTLVWDRNLGAMYYQV
jgi:hypothetical protein